jgi:predicted TIM-barrel fold metal-dependent hydrolase
MIIDVDSHLREAYFLDDVYKLEAPFEDYTPVCIQEGAPHERRFQTRFQRQQSIGEGNGQAYNHEYMYDPKERWRGGDIASRQVAGYDMARRLDGNAAESLDKQFIFPTGISLPAATPGQLGAALCRAYNNWVRKLVSGFEDVLLPVAMMPAGCPEEMPGELRRAVDTLGFKAAHLVCYEAEKNLDHPDFYPYYAEAERLGVPLFCHPNGNWGFITQRFDNFLAMHVLGRPTNCTQALVGLVCGGVFERFPGLKVVFFECTAEWPLYWMHRMDDDFEWIKDDQHRHLSVPLSMPPSEYVKRNCYVTLEADEVPGALRMALDELGEDRILMATDYPHFDSEYPHTVTKLRQNAVLTPLQKDKILGENARELLKL